MALRDQDGVDQPYELDADTHMGLLIDALESGDQREDLIADKMIGLLRARRLLTSVARHVDKLAVVLGIVAISLPTWVHKLAWLDGYASGVIGSFLS